MRKEKEKKIDGTLLVTVWILLGLGLVILYSASAYNGRVRFHDPAYYFKKQLFASALGVIGMYAVAKIDYRRLFALAPWFYAASLALSTAVLFFGRTRYCSRALTASKEGMATWFSSTPRSERMRMLAPFL